MENMHTEIRVWRVKKSRLNVSLHFFLNYFFYQTWKLSEVGDPLISLGFAPRINPSDFCGFFITATAWGQFKQKGDEEMRDGTAEVKYYDFFCVKFFFFALLNIKKGWNRHSCLCLQCQWILAFSIHFEIFQTLLFVFQLCVHHGELSLSQFTLKSRASSALVRMAGGSDQLLVTTVAQVQHHLSFAKTNSKDRKTL